MALDLEKQYLFYGAYHHNPVNIAIHIICVPVIMFCIFLWVASAGPLFFVPELLDFKCFPPNAASIAGFSYASLYVVLEPIAGILLAPLLLGGTALVNYLNNSYGSAAVYWSLWIQAGAWIFQIVGHAIFERRSPAFVDNVVQALFLAPLFVWLEILFSFGYRPNLKARLDKAVNAELARLNSIKKSSNIKAM
ncbi:hypothetical protein LOZ12_003995 [Ophidiomyces ophidiicola]|uniref:Uncharacterized protein n=1 Tax=Ophidiomyces ophidiicola TaxID=1387563 RepID=A0ACB8UTS7_9EURO|nr:uncharacterized protein LOZ57_001412 [Ophidiomyces ophidiicola]KAI1906849.1 hypothetical protein LOZ64_006118 [Ophidiomyces ophidiicola]KAI1907596.1 hypothetical protein LOZ61_006014 [Ophidiomyces ophidiicola]KAI1922858.1 hypothetical protein LOZ60_005453 [Ophidiomyces ophidiicola]KAI1939819.1 hypothetical protein LOZ62_004976 [Ophidiomyces ophidiicola]KAI1951998.1 hypothetical protein LOZ57_001412 [Ophidiomyces ophidiicola]